MKRILVFSWSACTVALLAVGLGAQSGSPDKPTMAGQMKAEQVISSWKAAPKEAAQAILKKYGQPQEVTTMRLIWHDNGPWKRTEVFNEEIDHDFPIPHKDAMHQVVNYRVDPDDADDILKYDGSVILNRTRGEIGSICDKEPANFLAVNLADDIFNGKRSVDEARKHYAESIMLLMKEKKMNEYTSGLRFTPPAMAGFSDHPFDKTGTARKQ